MSTATATDMPTAASRHGRTRTPRRLPDAAAVRWVAVILYLMLSVVGFAEQPPIASVAVVGDGPVDSEAVVELLGLQVGEPVDLRQLRETIHALFARADVEWLRVEGEERANGLHVLVQIRNRTEISAVDVRVRKPILKNRIRKWLELEPGTRVTTGEIEAAQRRVLRRLQDRGFFDARVDTFLDYTRASNTVRLTVEVFTGEPLVVGEVVVTGVDDPEIALEARPEVKPGTRLTTKVITRIRNQTEARLRGAGFWDAHVIGIDQKIEESEVSLEVGTVPGPLYQLEVDTPPEHDKLVRRAIPDPAVEDLHPAQTAALEERIIEGLQGEGYLLAEVAVQLDETDIQPVLWVEATPGAQRRIAEVVVDGAHSVSSQELLSSVVVHPGPVRGFRGQTVSSTTLEQDRLLLADTYRSYGFVDVEVGEPILEAVGDDAVRVVFPVVEGQRWVLTDLRIEGLPVESAGRLEQVELGLSEATPWHPRQVETTRRQLELILADTGYPDGRVEATVDTSVVGEARVVMRAEPGPFVTIGNVVIAGLVKTNEGVVQRTIRRSGVVTGEPFARDRMLEAQRRLYALGLFRRVELLPLPGREHRAERGVVVACEEGRQRSYLFGVGWNETDRFRITLGWSHLNLFGGAHAVSAEVRFSSREQRYQFGVREPWVPKLNAPAYMVVYRTFEEYPERGYDQLRRGLWIDAGDRLKRPFRTWWRYEYQIVQPEGEPIEREDQEALIASITPTLEWDYRDDLLVPTRGTFTSVSLEWAFPIFQADSEFLKLQSRFSLYRRMLDGIGAFGVRVGAIEPLGSETGVPANLQVPINTRFFSGGASSHRAFNTDTLGIPGQTVDPEGNPIGGNALVLINFEYTRRISGMFAGVTFVDVGNVWEEPSAVRLEDFRWGAGIGLRVDTPAGPLRAEYGWKLDREPGEEAGRFFLSFGIPF
jgi:outer membrane protein insertion porin family